MGKHRAILEKGPEKIGSILLIVLFFVSCQTRTSDTSSDAPPPPAPPSAAVAPPPAPITSVQLVDPSGTEKQVVLNTADTNMLVLWASWCGPCRREIPDLRRIYAAKAGSKHFHLVSISMDRKIDDWLTALAQEKMPWEQYTLSSALRDHAGELLNFTGILPTVILLDKKGNVLKFVTGSTFIHNYP